jgi:hypothetical protein
MAKKEMGGSWTLSKWLDNCAHMLRDKVADALKDPLVSKAGIPEVHPEVQLAYMKALGKADQDLSQKLFEALLKSGRVMSLYAETLSEAAAQLSRAKAATAEELNSKFATEKSFELAFGKLSDFSRGLEGMIGAPNPNIMEAMMKEHCNSKDSKTEFTPSNYGITTTSEIEWEFVTNPEKRTTWPVETKNNTHPRKATPLAEFLDKLSEINERLAKLGLPTLIKEEVIGLRLYTGPMFMKYNAVCRGGALDGSQIAFMRNSFHELCMGNRFPTTIHVINSALIKLGKLQEVRKVYRGVSGGLLPDEFWIANEFGVCGGVEFGFMSTTTNPEVAKTYAGEGVSMVIECQMGMVDRGADLSWLSQYPNEKEICFPPLTGMQVMDTRIEHDRIVVEMRLSVNQTAQTIEKVIQKRWAIVDEIMTNIQDGMRAQLAEADSFFWGTFFVKNSSWDLKIRIPRRKLCIQSYSQV